MFLQPSRLRLAVLTTLYVVHCVITAITLTEFSLVGIFLQGFLNWGTGQILSDLTFAMVIVCTWLAGDARSRGVAAWPWVLATMVFGSLSPGLYLIVRELALVRGGSSEDPRR